MKPLRPWRDFVRVGDVKLFLRLGTLITVMSMNYAHWPCFVERCVFQAEFGSSPRSSTVTASGVVPSQQQPEPLLSLLTSTHPLISSAINGSMSAYSSSKSYSPRFKSGAEFIERTIGSPVVNTVGTVGRKTGVESGLRWALQRRESSSVAEADRSKRRRVDNFQGPEQADLERGLDEFLLPHRMRSSSDSSLLEPLPPYDELRSPQYEAPRAEHAAAAKNDGKNQAPGTWQSRLMISTSGLGVAMSEESLRSLQYCLAWLRWANGRIGKAVMALQDALKEWESHEAHNAEVGSPSAGVMTDDGAHTHSPNIRRDNKYNTLLSQRIQSIKEDVLSTLKQVVKIVSKYAGGALPENARNLVRRHLTSLPRRFQVASISRPPPDSSAATSDATVGAHRILVLAQEGLDMLAQVSGVVNDTLVSAEHWCARLGMKRPDEKNASEVQGPAALPATVGSFPPDVKQPVVLETCT